MVDPAGRAGPDLTLGVAPAPRVSATLLPSSVAGLRLEDLIVVARRHNPKRQVLFVSPVLGKHLAVAPATSLAAGMALGSLVEQALGAPVDGAPMAVLAEALATGTPPTVAAVAPRPSAVVQAVVIGFAETATGLGHAVRRRLGPGPLSHTTRLPAGTPLVTCAEAHSHAVDHAVHHADPAFLATDVPVVIVDDEQTTGSTALDLIAAIQARWPRSRYLVASLVDWRTPVLRERVAEVAASVGTTIDTVSLIDAVADVAEAVPAPAWTRPVPAPPAGPVTRWELAVGPPTARRGWTEEHQAGIDRQVADAAGPLRAARHGDRALVLGTEELMYLPMVFGLHLGEGVVTRSTTRSPVVAADAPGYPITDRVSFAPLDGGAGERHLYNLRDEHHHDAFVFVEAPGLPDDHGLLAELALVADHVHLVVLS